jgi:DNA-binding transcriptional ArsR family regulator
MNGVHAGSVPFVAQGQFVYNQSMNVGRDADDAVSRIAATIGERARARMLYTLLDGHARTSTELAVVAEVSPSTASVHLSRLKAEHLIKVLVQGKHHYFSLDGPEVARALEGLSVLAGNAYREFTPNTPKRLRGARTCYDHLAGALAVAWNDRLQTLGWLVPVAESRDGAYELTVAGAKVLEALGVDLIAARALRRRFAFACLDWSERRPHLGGALGAALLKLALRRRWVIQGLHDRAVEVTKLGKREMQARFGLEL